MKTDAKSNSAHYEKKSFSPKKNHASAHEKIELLYYDRWIAVIFKPSGLLSVPYSGFKGHTAQSMLEELLRRKGVVNSKHRPFSVHRLDRDTSGVMMFAMNEQSAKKIMNSWQNIVKERLYHALAEVGKNARTLDSKGIIDEPLALNAHNVGFVPKPNDKNGHGHDFKTIAARTHYKILSQNSEYALFELSLDTGKKNQIRAHLAYCGYPVAGDKEHRSRKNPFGRLCLHARTLEFEHPFTKEVLRFEVPEPQEWALIAKK